jgi:hypothetical protein
MADKINYDSYRLGTKDGELQFGSITAGNEIDSILIRNTMNYRHYIEMCRTGDGERKDGTILRSPGSCQIRAGDNAGKSAPGVYIEAVSGDLVLRAPSGKVRIEGVDIELTANGYNGQTGNVNISANEKIILDAGQMVDIKAKVNVKITSEKTVDVIGKSVLNIFGGMIDAADGAAISKTSLGSKGGPSDNELRMKAEL